MTRTDHADSAWVSLGIFAWNEERAVAVLLESLFRQTLFRNAREHGLRCEVLCLANGCSDRTAAVAASIFAKQSATHPEAGAFSARAETIAQRGKINAWNQFVHQLSSRDARFLFLMDADILLQRPETLWNMVRALEQHPEANIAVDRPCKDISFKPRKTLLERLSLAASRMTLSADAQLCAQLYCIRSETARNIYLPKDLAACDDGFIKALVCTDFLEHEIRPERICLAPEAEHTFEAYTSPAAILKNQKRQVIGQTIVHILVDQCLPALTPAQRRQMGEVIRNKETTDPAWLKRLIAGHLARQKYCWRLYPGLLGQRFRKLKKLGLISRMFCLPSAALGSGATLLASFLAYRSLKAGGTDYWPKAPRRGFAQGNGQEVPTAMELGAVASAKLDR